MVIATCLAVYPRNDHVGPLAGSARCGSCRRTSRFTGLSEPPGQPLALWYSRPARQWLEALPVGNGRLGGMIYGGVLAERIGLNEDTLWSGGPKDCDNPDALKTLPEIRALILKGEFAQVRNSARR